MKKLTLYFVLIGFLLNAPYVWSSENQFKKTLNQFIETALAQNPELLEAKSAIQVARQIPSQAGSLDDPMLQFELKNLPVDSFAFDQENMTQKHITLSQKLPFPGKLGLRTAMASKDIDIAEENYGDLRLKIIREVKQSYYELCFVLAAINITQQNKMLIQQFITITETKYSLGKGIQQDVLKAQVELSKIMDELIDLKRRKKSEKAKLNTLMNLLPQTPLAISHGISKTEFNFKIDELMEISEENRPVLKKIRVLKEKYLVAKQLAEREFYPNFNIGFRYGQRDDGPVQDRADFVSAFVGINIPLWYKSKQKKKVAQESYKIDVIRQTYNNSKNQIYLGIKTLMDKEAKGDETLKLIQKGILPQARQSLDSAMVGYSVDKVDFLTLLNNQLTLFKWEIKYHRELTNYEKNLAALENMVGKSLTNDFALNGRGIQ